MTTRDDIYQSIEKLLRERYSLTRDISEKSQVFHDLGLRGMDASEFLTEIFRIYKVDWTGFNFDMYFKGEYYGLVDLFNWLVGRSERSKEPLTIKHLVDVCENGSWFDPSSGRA